MSDNLTNTPLIEAVRGGQLSMVQELIAGGVDVNEPGEQGWTPLCFAAGRGNLELVTLLIANGAHVFKAGRDQRTPRMIAVAAGHVEVVKVLCEAEELVAEKPLRVQRKYCRAYYLKDLHQFANGDEDGDVVFLHEDNTVSRSAWSNGNVLQFNVPDDLDFMRVIND